MNNYNLTKPVITGIGITSNLGQGQAAFSEALLAGRSAFGYLRRPGRQQNSSFLGAEIPDFALPESFSPRVRRNTSFADQVALVTLAEAWKEAKLEQVDEGMVGLIIGGSNFKQRELQQTYQKYHDRAAFIRPNYGVSFMDTDLCGLCTEQFGIKGLAYTVGGASASGQLAIIQAIYALQTGQVDVCIAMGSLMDPGYLELQAFKSLGAMGSDRFAHEPDKACRPFDLSRDGFIYGESCGAIVLESAESADRRQLTPYATLLGWAIEMDGNRNPDPSYEGEVKVIKRVLELAQLTAREIDYINPHGTGSPLGDETEMKALAACGLSSAYINATKSLTGHGLCAAGTVEIIAVLLQMKSAKLHPTKNLESPIDTGFRWVQEEAISHKIERALSLSMGFGGINTALCLENNN